MRTITFHPIDGIPVADGRAEEFAYALHEQGRDFTVSTDNLITATRTLIKEGVIPHNSVVFKYYNHTIPIDKDGRIANWPHGFCDHMNDWLGRLLKPRL